jgi:hypothetical protein
MSVFVFILGSLESDIQSGQGALALTLEQQNGFNGK